MRTAKQNPGESIVINISGKYCSMACAVCRTRRRKLKMRGSISASPMTDSSVIGNGLLSPSTAIRPPPTPANSTFPLECLLSAAIRRPPSKSPEGSPAIINMRIDLEAVITRSSAMGSITTNHDGRQQQKYLRCQRSSRFPQRLLPMLHLPPPQFRSNRHL